MAFGAKIKLSVDNSRASAFRKEIQTYVNTATEKTPIYLHNIKVTATAKQSLISDLKKYLNSDTALVVKINSIDASGAISKLRNQLQTMLSGLSITGLKEFLGTDGVDATYEKAADKADKLAEAMENVRRKGVETNAALQELRNVQSALTSSFTNISKFETTDTTELLAEYEALNARVQELRSNEALRTNEAVTNIAREAMALRQKTSTILENESATKREANESKKAAEQEAINSSRAISLKSQIQRWILANSKAYKVYGDQIDSIMTALDTEAGISKERLGELRDKFREIDTAARTAGVSGNTFFDTFKKGLEKFGGWSLVTRSMMATYRLIKQIITAVRELDAAMTELKKVTDLTKEAYADFIKTASDMAQSVGASLTDTVNATADFARLGYSIDDAAKLAEAALVYKNVGDGIDDISEATESLISTIKAFGIEANSAMGIIDKFNEVGNNFAISSEGIGVALQKSASALAAANNSLEESIALATGMNSVLQNPEVVGTALKTVSMYLRAAKTDVENAGESTDGMANSVSELRDELLKLTKNKVDILLDDSTFKSTYQILKELSEVWQDIADVDQANILELVGGKRNATAITSLLNNFKDAEAALQTAQEAAGSATAENEKYLDSINGKLDILQAKFETIANNLLDSSFVKFILDIATGLAEVLTLLSQFPFAITTIVAGISAISGALKMKEISQLTSRIMLQKAAILEEGIVTDSLAASIAALSKMQQKALVIQLQKKVVSGEITREQYNQIISTTGLAAAEKGLVAADGSLIAANHGLAASFKALMASIPIIGWISLAITLVIELVQWITTLISNSNSAREQAIQDANAIIDAYSEAQNTFESNTKSLEDMREEFERLSKGVDANGENISLTASQYEEYLALIKEIVGISPEVCKGYDSEGNAIVNYTTVLNDAIKAQETYMNNQRNMYLGSGNEVFNGKKKEYENAKKDLGKAAEKLGDELNEGFWSTLFNPSKADAKLAAYHDAFDELGIQFRTGIDTWKSSTNSVMQMYENADEIMVLLRNSGAYTEEELIKIEDKLHGLAGAYSTLKNVQKEQVDYLAEWSKDQAWYSTIPTGALDEFYDGLMAIDDPMKDYNENIKNASKFGTEFSKALETDNAKSIIELSKGLRDGTTSLEEYNAAVRKFTENYDGTGVVNSALTDYFNSLSDNAIVVTTDYIKSLSDLSDTISDLQNNYKLLDQAQSDMAENGTLSANTIKSIRDAMDDGENYLDYLEMENGQIKLNTTAWKERAAATMMGDFEEIQKEVASLDLQNEKLREQIRLEEEARQAGNDGNIHTNAIKEYTDEIERNNENIRENQDLLSLYGAIYDEIASDFYDAFNYDTMVNGLESVGNSVSKLVSAMESLAAGTALTKQELVSLALEYPKLLEASDLFTDGSIQGQQAMLDNILQIYEAEYDATIDTKIAELTATKEALEARIEAETQKAEILDEIANNEVNNTAQYRAWLTNKLAEFNEIEEGNYITYQNGVLGITEEALNDRLKDEYDAAEKTASDIWEPMSTTIATAFSSGGTAGLSAMETLRSKLGSWIQKVKDAFLSLARTIASAITGKEYSDGSGSGEIDTTITANVGDVKFDGKDVTINGQSLDSWVSEQQRVTAERIEQIKNQIGKIDVSIDNLKKLKGLDLQTIYEGTGKSSSKSKKEIEEYIADIDEYYAAIKRLEKAQELRSKIEKQIKNTDDPAAKIALERQLIDAYKEETKAEENLMNLKRSTIAKNVKALRELGFVVSYNSATNELFISNLEHINELTATSAGEYETLQEATNALRKSAEDLIDVTEDLNDDNKEAIETIQDLTYSIKDSKENILSYIQEMVDAANDVLSSVTDVYDTLHSAAESYNENGFLTADMFQSILGLGTKYLSFLYDESGAIKFNEETLQKLIKAKIEDLAVTQAMALVDTVREYKDDAEALKALADATYDTSDATWSLVYANLAMLGLDSDMYDAFSHQIAMLRELSDVAKAGVGQSSISDYYNDASDALQYILDKTQELIQYEVEQQIKALQDQIDKYKEIIDLKKESLRATKDEEDYEKNVADKVKEIAELQAKIDQLSLDDSRSAQAQRNALLSELAEKQAGLAELQSDHAFDAQTDALDKMADAYEQEKQTEIEILEDSISSTEKIYQMALGRLQDNWNTLYEDLISWNTIAGNSINDEITENWKRAAQAVNEYGSYLQALASITNGVSSSSSPDGDIIASFGIPKYHNGGVVGKPGQDEVLALLQDGEVVLNDKKQETLYEIIDFYTELARKLGVKFADVGLPSVMPKLTDDLSVMPRGGVGSYHSSVFSPQIEVKISHNGNMTDSDAKHYGKEVADVAIERLYSAFERRGISNSALSKLKP